MKILPYTIVLMMVLIAGCKKEETDIDKLDMQLVTGMVCKGTDGASLYTMGNPNDWSSSSDFCIYPNPVNDVFSIHCEGDIKKIWIVQGDARNTHQDIDFTELFSSNKIDTTGIETLSLQKIKPENNRLLVSMADEAVGYYKVIVETDDNLLFWQIIYKVDSDIDFRFDQVDYNIWK